MYLIPEVLDIIATHLSTSSFYCCQVCRFWNSVFTRHFWHSVNDYEAPWGRVMLPIELEERPQLLIKTNGSFIHELALSELWMLEAVLDGRLVSNLTKVSKKFFTEMDRPCAGLYSDKEGDDYEEYSSHKARERLVQIWELIANNHNLESFVFMGAYAASYIPQNLTTIAPHITSFVYSEGFEGEYDDIYGRFLKGLKDSTTTPCTTL
ncbi:hypothetical protein KI688_002325 [Linnemannia hyalina]|uniref:F-box domain-containing protein n=1 Tax=Linnemannia hyalina TaxID=64524 RepID=A0A9P8BRH0_9FUNG|nr:hypothetical protein KI688_002325 [Linnemannia hyalina]